MTDPADEALPEWTEDELALLRSAELDRPRSQSLPAALAAVGVGSAIATSATAAHGAAAGAAGAAASAKWGGVAAASKWLAVVALSGTVAAGAVVIAKRSAGPHPPQPSAERAAPTAAKQLAPRPVETPAAVPADQNDVEQPSANPAAVAHPAAASASAARRAIPSQPDIRVELAVLDGAMKSLRAGNAAGTLAALDRYDAQYAKIGALHVEATALRIEALVQTGQRAQANALATAFLSGHPKSPYAARIRALFGEAGASAR